MRIIFRHSEALLDFLVAPPQVFAAFEPVVDRAEDEDQQREDAKHACYKHVVR